MKTLTALKRFIPLVLVVLFTYSCSDDDDSTPIAPPAALTISDLADSNPNLSSLVAALDRTNLFSTLDSEGSFTVFAPDNNAFNAFLSANGFTNLEDVPVDVLTQVLLNHVIAGEASSSSLTTEYKSTLATEATSGNNLSIYVDISAGVTLNGVSNVIAADVMATNGIVHVVDAVIGLPTVVDFALADSTFDILVAALTRSDLEFDYVGTLSTPNGTPPAPFTVFAPTNDAFVALLEELGASSLSDIDTETLTATLNLHAVAGANVLASSLTDDMTVTTLGGDITANVTGGATLTDANGRISNIIVTNVQAANGVIHVIDKVVLPQLPQNIVGLALDNPNLTSLVAALQAADGNLVDVLNGPGPFTVLAPDNNAFDAFLSANGFATLGDVPTDVLAQILLNHVISGPAVMSSDLISAGEGYASTNATGAGGNFMSLYYNTSSGVTFNGISTVSMADIEATNGVIHMVDAVIGLPTIVDHAIANPNLTELVGALTSFGTTFTDVLSTPGDFTVFAPVNAAFDAFTNPDGNDLDKILSNHVIAGATAISGSLTNEYQNTIATYTGGGDDNLSIYINTDNGVTLNGISSVVIPDIIASNGVVHAVDAVIDIPTVTTFAVADPNFSTLVQALTTLTPATDFAGILSRTVTGNGDGIDPSFTVFAPTNDAFAALPMVPAEAELTQILLHHVIGGANVRSSGLTPNGDTVAGTLEGDNITISLPGTNGNIADVRDGAGNTDIGIIAVDVQAGNGVIHVLNKVMINN